MSSEGRRAGTANARDIIASLSPERQQAIAERAAELKAEVRSVMELRKAMELTQAELARKLDISQESVSRLEKRSDMLISTLTKHVEKLGGELVLLARFPGAAPVRVRLGDADPSRSGASRRGAQKRVRRAAPAGKKASA